MLTPINACFIIVIGFYTFTLGNVRRLNTFKNRHSNTVEHRHPYAYGDGCKHLDSYTVQHSDSELDGYSHEYGFADGYKHPDPNRYPHSSPHPYSSAFSLSA
jgi:hypothetical protein